MKETYSFERQRTTNPVMQHHKPGDQNPKVYVVMVVSMNIMAFWGVMP